MKKAGIPKKEVERITSQILNNTALNTFVSEHQKEWLIENVFKRHSQWEEKARPGVCEVRVRMNLNWPTRGFELVRVDGSLMDISITECFNKTLPRQRYLKALRNAVQDQILVFACEHKFMPGFDQVDHVKSFKDLVLEFEAETGLVWETVKIKHVNNDAAGEQFESEELKEIWQGWHQKHAVLQVLSVEEHKAKTKAEKRK